MFMAFRTAADVVAAAGDTQPAIAAQQWPERGIWFASGLVSTPESSLAAPPKYVGLDVHRAAWIMAASNGGQVLLSDSTERLLAGDERALDAFRLRDLGPWRLKDFDRPVRLYELGGEGHMQYSRGAWTACRAPEATTRRGVMRAAVVVVVGAIIVVSRGGGDGLEAPPQLARRDRRRSEESDGGEFPSECRTRACSVRWRYRPGGEPRGPDAVSDRSGCEQRRADDSVRRE